MNHIPHLRATGFTLMEVLLVIALIGILTGISLPVGRGIQLNSDLTLATNTITQSLRRAQVLSQTMQDDGVWGVDVRTGSITVFQGTTYTTRNTERDELFELPASITPSGMSEVTFAQLTGDPQSTGTISLTSSNAQTRTVTVNSVGMVEW